MANHHPHYLPAKSMPEMAVPEMAVLEVPVAEGQTAVPEVPVMRPVPVLHEALG